MSVFLRAAQLKLRFATNGQVAAEDLFDVKLVELKRLGNNLHKALKGADDDVFDTAPSIDNEENQLRFDIVKIVVDMRVAELAARTEAKANRERKQKILEIIAGKQDDALQGKTVEELNAMLDNL